MPDTHQGTVPAKSLKRTEDRRGQTNAIGHVLFLEEAFLDGIRIYLVKRWVIMPVHPLRIHPFRQADTRRHLDRSFDRQRQADRNRVLCAPLERVERPLEGEQRCV